MLVTFIYLSCVPPLPPPLFESASSFCHASIQFFLLSHQLVTFLIFRLAFNLYFFTFFSYISYFLFLWSHLFSIYRSVFVDFLLLLDYPFLIIFVSSLSVLGIIFCYYLSSISTKSLSFFSFLSFISSTLLFFYPLPFSHYHSADFLLFDSTHYYP